MKEYSVHFEQENQMWIYVEASSKRAAINKAIKKRKLYYPEPDAIQLPNGTEESL